MNVSVDQAWKNRLVPQVDHLVGGSVSALKPCPELWVVCARIVLIYRKNEPAFLGDDDHPVAKQLFTIGVEQFSS